MFNPFSSDPDQGLYGWLSLGLLASGRALQHTWETHKPLLIKARTWLTASPYEKNADPLAAPIFITDCFNPGASAQPYSPFTHYSVRWLRTGTVESNGTRVVSHLTLEWRVDRDGRDHELHELNLGYLDAEVIEATPLPSKGARRFASLAVVGGPVRRRFFLKD